MGRMTNSPHSQLYRDSDPFAPRVYAKTWWLLPRLQKGTLVSSPSFGIDLRRIWLSLYKGFCRFSNPRKPMDEVQRLACTIEWKRKPTYVKDPYTLRAWKSYDC